MLHALGHHPLMDVFYLLFCLSLVLFSTAQTLTTTDVYDDPLWLSVLF